MKNVQSSRTISVVVGLINTIHYDFIIKAAISQTAIPQHMMGFDLWKVLQMRYHILGISQSTSDLHRDLQQPALYYSSERKSAATNAAVAIHSYFDTFN